MPLDEVAGGRSGPAAGVEGRSGPGGSDGGEGGPAGPAGGRPRGRHMRGWWHAPWRRLPSARMVAAIILAIVVTVLVLRAGSARHDFLSAFQRVRADLVPWLALGAAFETASFYCYGMAQRRLLSAGGAHLPRPTMFGLAFSATGLSAVVPGGVVPASGWLIGQYRRRQVPMALGVWAVLANGFASTVSVLALLLIGAAIAGVGNSWALGATGAVLVVGSGAFVYLVHRLDMLEEALKRHHGGRVARFVHWVARRAADVVSFRASIPGGIEVFGWSTFNWLFDTGALVASFAFLGLPVPWRAVLFAYAVSQVAGSLIPLPAGIGVVAGGLVGAFVLAGVPSGEALVASLVYRVLGYWLVAACGSLGVIWLSHRPPRHMARLDGETGVAIEKKSVDVRGAAAGA